MKNPRQDIQGGALDLAGLVAARLCHDLANPLGAIGNGIDLIRELGEGASPEDLALVADAQARAAALLGFHRLALGNATPDGAPVTRAELAGRAEAALGSPRVKLEWSGLDGPALARPVARLGALMVLAARALLGLEGRLVADIAPGAGVPLSVHAEGARAQWTETLEAVAFGGAPAEPRLVEFALLMPAAAAAGAKIRRVGADGRAGLEAD